MNNMPVDHLFRHHYGKMVAVLTRLFGPSNIELIEDAIQDTFTKAIISWRDKLPDTPEAWLTTAAKNRAIDLLRQINAESQRVDKIVTGPSTIQLNELFLEHEIEDSQLRMIFMACHPALKPQEQIAFSLKTISGFSIREISTALLAKEETIKKRLSRARATISKENIQFDLPNDKRIKNRLERVMEVIYLIFNEGFHSSNPQKLVREDLCGEALRLAQLLLKKKSFRSPDLYALLALMCFHASRLESKIGENNQIIDLKHQDRKKWYQPMIQFGHAAMLKATDTESFSAYHYEAAIAGEHLRAKTFEDTDWNAILGYYRKLEIICETPSNKLNLSIVLMQLNRMDEAKAFLDQISLDALQQRQYLVHGCYAEYYSKTNRIVEALKSIDLALNLVSNQYEKAYLEKKRLEYSGN